ncbi:Beta-barrel assembly-enhancing protease [BD1-7 clade bacterium]|uniref:Beta-barrel assembly-enhancing protease n=1 Tax=BD1-7 clade bacterium TaxID=2029982 RepID=A0A5S9PJK0_9GAMM|nr:Beta-barrel assembly-enhancing protease [BD1-7 clade bacterium]CAA0104057.1 Beta-barrel assembly-enhancing protease [BD1-7 clade bacterium]
MQIGMLNFNQYLTQPLRVVVAVSTLLLATACSTSPTGRSQMILVGDDQMNEMGKASFAQMKSDNPPSIDKPFNDYVMCLSTPLLKAAGENPSEWEVKVFDDDSPNAFALPGKKIGVHTGMISLAETPDQLAAVIGHEIGHVQAKHGAERVSMGMAAQTAQQVSAVALNGVEYGDYALAAIGAGAQYGLILPYSRTHETEADYIGLLIMAKAGFNPDQAVALWQKMKQSSGGNAPPEFLSTHPAHGTRIRDLGNKQAEARELYEKAIAEGVVVDCIKPEF